MICVKYIEFNIIVETALQIMRLPDIWKYENFDIVKQRNPTDNLFTSIILFCFNRVNYKKTIFILYSYTCMRGIGDVQMNIIVM